MKPGGRKSRLLPKLKIFPLLFFFFGGALFLFPQNDKPPDDAPLERGDAAAAERYAQWAEDKIGLGLWSEALAGLERAADFAAVSSDISYLLALARSHENKPRALILEALNYSLAVGRWKMYLPEEARRLKAETLIAVRAYSEALDELSRAEKGPAEAALTLKALAVSRQWEFRETMSRTLDRYPRETGPARVFFDYLRSEAAAGRNPEKEDTRLLELIIRRLPVLLLKDRELAWIAAPFMRDTAEAKRLVQAYRAAGEALPGSLPAALKLGVIDEETALEELFAARKEPLSAETPHNSRAEEAGGVLDMAVLSEIWELLRHEGARALFRRNLSAYTGVIKEDGDRDGIFECETEYSGGVLKAYTYDAEQDGVPDLAVSFEAGDPRRALALIPPESSRGAQTAAIEWERYPALLEAELDGVRYVARPLDFHYAPLMFDALWGSGALIPRRTPLSPPLTRRVLVSRVLRVERPSLEFPDCIEKVELAAGIPVSAREYSGEELVSETDFVRGRPQFQRVDLDRDGRLETGRRFRRNYRAAELEDLWDYDRDIEYTVSDWDGDGIFESRDSFE